VSSTGDTWIWSIQRIRIGPPNPSVIARHARVQATFPIVDAYGLQLAAPRGVLAVAIWICRLPGRSTEPSVSPCRTHRSPCHHASFGRTDICGWGGRIRTSEWRGRSPCTPIHSRGRTIAGTRVRGLQPVQRGRMIHDPCPIVQPLARRGRLTNQLVMGARSPSQGANFIPAALKPCGRAVALPR